MKAAAGPSVALALASLYTRDPKSVERTFEHLTAPALDRLNGWLVEEFQELNNQHSSNNNKKEHEEFEIHHPCHRVLAQAVIRRIVHKCLDKYQKISPPEVVEEALKHYVLPDELQQSLVAKYGGDPPTTWYQSLKRLRQISNNESNHEENRNLWRLVQDHPMCSYVPMQCQQCGHVVPDNTSGGTDVDVGLSEEDPEGTELGLRGGWYRGRPRGAKVLRLTCPQCHTVSTWYRSGHPRVVLNPYRWGRLCGEQEELRLSLARYLGVSLRTVLPLDWDHVLSEFQTSATGGWDVHDPDALNFCCRLNENIGSWTGVWAIHPDPFLCQDITNEYLSCRDLSKGGGGGRADPQHGPSLLRYRQTVQSARQTLEGTQAGTVNGYALQRGGFDNEHQITSELQRAARDYGNRAWWQP